MKVVEVFGPTIQGEGPHAGRVTHFVRFGGCDYRCEWCDTPDAVLPERVRLADDLSEDEIVARLDALLPAPMVVLSGGNPALWQPDHLIGLLTDRYRTIAVETQGSRWRDWLGLVQSLVISPKPPSSGEVNAHNAQQFERFMDKVLMLRVPVNEALKVVVFDADDLAWAKSVHSEYPDVPFYLSVGTDPDGADHADTVAGVGARYAWLCERVVNDLAWHDVTVLPQLHVVAWGHKVGV